LDYIEKNLSEKLTLEKLAGIANFSAYHFHRLFKAFVGETLFQFIQRVRLERAADVLVNHPKNLSPKLPSTAATPIRLRLQKHLAAFSA